MGTILSIILYIILFYLGLKVFFAILAFAVRWYISLKLHGMGFSLAEEFYNRTKKYHENSKKNSHKHSQDNADSSRQSDSESMVKCAKCSTYIPVSQANKLDNQYYCANISNCESTKFS